MFLSLKFIHGPASYFLFSSCGFGLIALRSLFGCVCVKGEGCVWVCAKVHVWRLGGIVWELGLLPTWVLRRLEPRLRPARQVQLPASVSLQSIDPCCVLSVSSSSHGTQLRG